MKHAITLIGASIFATAPFSASADDVAQVAAQFGALEAVSDISLSPDGNKVAYVSPKPGGGQILFVADLSNGGEPKSVLAQSNPGESLTGCAWVTDQRLACRIYVIYNNVGTLLGFTRMFAVNADGSNIGFLTPSFNDRQTNIAQNGGQIIDYDLPGQPGHILMSRVFIPEEKIGSLIAKRDAGLGVEDVDITTLARRKVEGGTPDAVEYISDGNGNVRIMGLQGLVAERSLRGEIKYLYRRKGSREWLPFSVVNALERSAQIEPYAVDPTLDVAYGFSDRNGFTALMQRALDGTNKETVLLSRADVDIDQLVTIGRSRRVVGASFATERRTVEYFDPELKKLAASLARALPGKPAIDIVDANADESKLLLFAYSDTQPGTLYLFDKTTRKLGEVLPIRPGLGGAALAPMKPITFPAADGTPIPAYLTLPPGGAGKNVPAIVMPHGGPSARDEWGFDWLVQFFAARGFAVIQPNYRGSSGYGAAWFQKNGFQSWRTAIGDVNDAGRWLVSQGIADPNKLAIVGWSYGGYAALQSSVVDPSLFKAIVAIAPVTDLQGIKDKANEYVSGRIVARMIGAGPHIREGSPAQNAGRIAAPVLMFHGDKDQNVDIEQSRLMARKLRDAGKAVEMIEFPGLAHSLHASEARTRMLERSDAFLRQSLGIR